MMLKITQIRTSDDDWEGKYVVELGDSQMEALTRILARLESTYDGWTPPYTSRAAEASALSSFLSAAKRLDIPFGI